MRRRFKRWTPRASSTSWAFFAAAGSLRRGATGETGELPNMIWLYRRPLLDFWCDGEDSLDEVVTHVLVHEIGHHFGLSDADMEAIEETAR